MRRFLSINLVGLCLINFLAVSSVSAQDSVALLRQSLQSGSLNKSEFLENTFKLIDLVKYTNQDEFIVEFSDTAIQIAASLRDTGKMVRLHGEAGDFYWKKGKLPESAEEFNQIRLLAQPCGNSEWMAVSYNGLGIVQYLMGQNDQSLEYFLLGKDLVRQDSTLLMRLYNNIANIYLLQENLDSVLAYYQRVYAYDLRHGNPTKISNTLLNLTIAYTRMDSVVQAREYANRSLQMARESKNPRQIALVYRNMAGIIAENHPVLSITYYKEAYENAKLAKAGDLEIQIAEQLVDAYQERQKVDSAFYYLNEAYQIQDSSASDLEKRIVTEIKENYDWAVSQIQASQADYKIHLAQIKKEGRTRVLLTLSWMFLSVLIIVFYILYKSYTLRNKINQELASSNATKDRFFSLIAHDLRSPLSGAVNLSEVMTDESLELDKAQLEHYAKALNISLNEVYNLVENLLQWSQSESGHIPFNPSEQLIWPVANEAMTVFTEVARNKAIQLENWVPDDLRGYFDKNMMNTILRNLVSNSLKFTSPGGIIRLSGSTKDGKLILSVWDNGTGMSEEVIDNLFTSGSVISTIGTHKETGSGLGLELCQEFISKHKGSIVVKSELGNGTEMIMSFPLGQESPS